MSRIKELSIFDKKKKFLKDDPLQFLVSSIGIFCKSNNPLNNSIILAEILFVEIYSIINIISGYILDNESAHFIRNISLFLLQQLGVSAGLTEILYWKDFSRWPKLIQSYCWSFDSADWETHKKIIRQTNRAKLILISHVVSCLLGHIAFTPIFGSPIDVNFTVLFVKKYTNSVYLAIMVETLFFCMVVNLGYTVARIFAVYVHPVTHIRFQFQLLQEHIKRISRASVFEKDLRDKKLQKEIYRRLVICIEQHIRLKKYTELVKDSVRGHLFLLFTGATCATSGSLILLLVNPGYYKMIQTIALIGAVAVEWYLMCGLGQSIQDESNLMYDLVCECPWNYWDKRNRNAYMMLLIHSQNPVIFSCFNLINLGHSTVVASGRIAYSVATLFATIKRK